MKYAIALLTTLFCVSAFLYLGLETRTSDVPQSPVVPDVAMPPQEVCPATDLLCPDGTMATRTGAGSNFVCLGTGSSSCPLPDTVSETHPDIVVVTPVANTEVTTPLRIAGKARGSWFFEASFPVVLTDWDGRIIAEGAAAADGDWMTTDFVPFSIELSFRSPYTATDPAFMQRGTLILRRDNPSGLPENDDAYEIAVQFAPATSTASQ